LEICSLPCSLTKTFGWGVDTHEDDICFCNVLVNV